MRRLRAITAILLSAGCYRYEPMTAPTPSVGKEYRATLNAGGAATLEPVLGKDVVVLDGMLRSESIDTLRFAVSRTQTRQGRVASWTGEVIDMPRTSVAHVQRRVLDRPKTFRAAMLGILGGIAVGLVIKGIGGTDNGTGGGPIGNPL